MTPCPDADTFSAFADQTLSAGRRADVVAHADTCDRCRALVVELIRGRSAPPASGIANLETVDAAAISDTLAAGSGDSTQLTGAGPITTLAIPPGATIDRYRIEARLGAGGMGVVYAAHDPELDRPVAVKLLHARALGDSYAGESRIRLMREAQAVAKISHPNVIAVHDIGTWKSDAGDDGPGQVFVAMELVDGWNLRQWCAEAPRTWREILRAYLAAGRGIEAAHAVGLVHRDIKPDNILIGRDGRIRVTDFGMARVDPTSGIRPRSVEAKRPKREGLSTPLTQTGAVLGTPAYMAPEQHEGQATDARTDQFSFCVALWEGLYGERPFDGADLDALADAVLDGKRRPPPPGTRVPGWIRRAVERGLAVEPAERWPTMTALLAALSPERRRRRWIALGVGAAIVAAAGITLAIVRAPSPTPCRGMDRALTGVWDAPHRDRAIAAVTASGAPNAAGIAAEIARRIDGYTTAWVAMRTEACTATRIRGDQDVAVMDVRMRCLDERLVAINRVIELAAGGDAALVRGVATAVESLPRIEDCANTAALLAPYDIPLDPSQAGPVAEVRAAVAGLIVDLAAGRFDAMEAALADADRRARAIGWPPLEAEVTSLVASAKARRYDRAGEERALREAIQFAEAGKHDMVRADAAVRLIASLAAQGKLAEAEQWADYARAVVARLGGVPRIDAALDENLAMLREGQGRFDESTQLLEAALALRRRDAGDDSLDVASTYALLASVLQRAGKLDDARAAQRQATAIWTKVFGPDSMASFVDFESRSTEALLRGDYATVIELEHQAQAVIVRVAGPTDPARIESLRTLALALELAGDPDQALAAHRDAIGLLDQTGTQTEVLAFELGELGAVAFDAGRTDEALAAYTRAEQVAAAVGPGAEAAGIAAKVGIGKALIASGKPAEAIAPLEATLAFREIAAHAATPNQLGSVRFALARALRLAGRDRARSQRLATAALADFHTAADALAGATGPNAAAHAKALANIAEVEAWRRDQ